MLPKPGKKKTKMGGGVGAMSGETGNAKENSTQTKKTERNKINLELKIQLQTKKSPRLTGALNS
jgi:hypothetical protein